MKEHIQDNKEGSITVFLSLVLLLVLSLIMTVIEGARFYTAKVMAERALTTAMDSVLAEFYGPLMEEYHLLGLDAGYGSNLINTDEMENRLKDYMSYTFSPNSGLSGVKPGIELYNITLEDADVDDIVRITEHGSKLFINEACGYMKYKVAGEGLELLLNKLNLLEKPKKVSCIYEKKLEVAEQLALIDKGILSLMEQLDGISTGGKGLNTDKNGNIKAVSDYVKKICPGEPDMEKVGINNSFIFEAIKSSYYDPTYPFDAINTCFNELDSLSSQISYYYTQQAETNRLIADEEEKIIKLEEELKLLEEKLASQEEDMISQDEETATKGKEVISQKEAMASQEKELTSNGAARTSQEKELTSQEEIRKDIEDVKIKTEACRENKKELDSRLKDIEDNINSLQIQIDSCVRNITSLIGGISDNAERILPVINDAGDTVETLIEESTRTKPLIADYETVLSTEGQDLDEATREGLYEELGEIKKYEPDSGCGYDFIAMKDILAGNAAILTEVLNLLGKGKAELSSGANSRAREYVDQAALCLSSYHISNLKLDYSTLVENREVNNPHDKVKSVLTDSLMELVIDTGRLSGASLNNDNLPSYSLAAREAESSFSFKKLIGGMKAESSSGMGGLFSGYNDMGLSGMLVSGVNIAAEKLLFQEYLFEHFYRMPFVDEDTSGRKPTALSYEQEYLITGKNSDKDNLSSVISRIILLRTLLDLTSALGNKEKMNETRALATALVGFTGVFALVLLTQTLLLILLAFSEALVDTCAILSGKELPVLKKSFEMSVHDMFMLNREYIQQKADRITMNSKGLTLGYQDYIKIFLFFMDKEKTSYKCMDLIQENLRLNYDEDFNIQNCLFGFDARAEFKIRSSFITIPYIQKYIHGKGEANYSVRAGYSY